MAFIKKIVKGAKTVLDLDSDDRGGGGYGDLDKLTSIQGYGQTFLHGYLVIQVKEAKEIPDMENWYSKLYDKKDVTDPFVDVKLGKAR